jgi:hypothetical protein
MKTENELVKLVAMDRIEIPISSMSGKLKREKPKYAARLEIEDSFEGERAYARVESEDILKARGMKDAIAEFGKEFPRYGKILQGKIEEKRAKRETHLYFGMNEGCRITSDDYMGVLTDLGFSETRAREFYPELMNVSRNLSRKRDEERRVLIG